MKTDKTLGPASAEILLRLSAAGKIIFSIADAQAVTDKSYKATATLLSQLWSANQPADWPVSRFQRCTW